MYILKKVCGDILRSVPDTPPEVGGILGSVNGIICKCVMDFHHHAGSGCFYSPNVEFLNAAIEEWQKEGIDFQGVFHTHFFGVETLSDGDIAYIHAIMQAMPICVKELHFPVVVLPEKRIVPYRATRNGNAVQIKKDVLNVL